MAPAKRTPYEWLTVVVGLLASLVWASLAVRAVVMDDGPSVRALLACVALVLVGFALGAVMWTLTAAKRAKRPPGAAGVPEMKAPLVLLALVSIGLGASPIVDASAPAWDWALLVGGSLVGGLTLGLVVLRSADGAWRSSATASSSSD